MNRRAFVITGSAVTVSCFLAATSRADEPAAMTFKELYGKRMVFSDKTLDLTGKEVVIEGYMAPPLKADADFFVMTKIPLAICPFCDNEADWPADILFVQMRERQDFVQFNRRIRVEGRLEVGLDKHEETGFVSRLRLADAVYETVV